MSSSVTSITQWQEQVAALLPGLRKSEAKVLGLLSYAMILTRGSGLTRLSNWLAQVEQVPVGRLRQRLREFYYEAKAKRGKKRREVNVEACFADLLRGLLKQWSGPKELVLALDASTLGGQFVTLNVSVVYRGCGIPVAWSLLRAGEAGEWKGHWLRLLAALAEVVPAEWKVLVMADRGLYAPWLYRAIQVNGWHPFLRVKENLTFRARGEPTFHPIRERVGRRGRHWEGQGEWSEQGETIVGTLQVAWEKGYEERLAVVTDLLPAEAKVAWYQMRFWIEDEYKDHKRGGFHGEHTKMSDPGRAQRLYLVMAVAMQAAVLVGGALEAQDQQQRGATRPQAKSGRRMAIRRVGKPAKPLHKPRGREQSCLERGCQAISAAVVRGERVPMGQIVAEPWPSHLYAVGKPASSWVKKRKRKEERKRQRKSQQAEVKRRERAEQAEQRRRVQTAHRELRQENAGAKLHRKEERGAKRQVKSQERETRQHWHQACACSQQQKQEEREAHRRVREQLHRDREQQWEERQRWHEEIARDRQFRLARKQERADRRAQATPASQRSASQIFRNQETLAPLAQPP